jgi:phosphoribosyl-ATP pyrophosphohydrolase
MIIPALQIRGGQAVALGGEGRITVLPEDPVELARDLYRYGEIAVLDLDAAREEGDNLELIRQICRVAECRVGGGIRDEQRGDAILRAGARSLMVGTGADEELLSRFPRSKVLVSLDIQDGRVVRRGWQEATDIDPLELALRLRGHCVGFVYALVGHRGRMERTELERFEALRSRLPDHSLTAAGGFTTAEDVRDLDRIGVDCQLGVGEQHDILELAEAFTAALQFEKEGGLLPVVVQDTTGQVLALRQLNEKALRQSLQEGRATYWSRVRGGLWTKGEGSGNAQRLRTVSASANRDALLYVVETEGSSEPGERYSQFGEMSYNLHRIEAVLRARQDTSQHPTKSYTSLMLADREGVRQRIRQEARALAEAESHDEVRWETADLIYFLLLNLAQEGVSLDEVIKELRGRGGRRRT